MNREIHVRFCEGLGLKCPGLLTPGCQRRYEGSLSYAERWVARFVNWYNGEHRHSAIRYVTPNERHNGRQNAVLARRRDLYERARLANPERWSRSTRNWSPVGVVVLNPERTPSRDAA